MKKQIIYGIYALLSVGFLIFGLYFGLENTSKWAAIISGVIIMAISIPIYQIGKTTKALYYVTIIMNSIATGLVISAYYNHFNEVPILETSILIGSIVALTVTILCFLTFSIKEKKNKKLISIFLVLLGYTVTITFWITGNEIIYSQLFFFMHICYFLLIAILNMKDQENYLKSAALSTFGLFAVVAFIVLVIVTEGEALEGVGYIGGGSGNKGNQIKG